MTGTATEHHSVLYAILARDQLLQCRTDTFPDVYKRQAMYRKSDSDDAEAIALATLNMLDKLPDACPNDAYLSLIHI